MPIETAFNEKTGQTVAWVNDSWQLVDQIADGPAGETAYLVNGGWYVDPSTTKPQPVSEPPKPTEEETSFLDAAQNLGVSALKVGPTAVKGLAELGSMVTGDAVDLGVAESMEEGMQAIDEVLGTDKFNQQQKAFATLIADDTKDIGDLLEFMVDNPAILVDQSVSSIGSMFLPLGAAGAAVKGAKALKASKAATEKALAATTIGTTAAQNAASTFAELEGAPLEDRYAGAAVSAATSTLAGIITGGGAEGAVAKKMLGDLQSGKIGLDSVTRFLKSVGKEAAQETGEEAGNILGEVTGGAAPTAETMDKRLALAGLLGGVVGGGVYAGTNLPSREDISNVITAKPATAVTQQDVDALVKQLAESQQMSEEDARTAIMDELAAKRVSISEGELPSVAPEAVAPTPTVTAPTVALAQPTFTPEEETQINERATSAVTTGVPADMARRAAIEELGFTPTVLPTTEEAPSAAQEAQPAEVAGKPVSAGTRVSPTVSMPAPAPVATGLAEAPERSGVVRAGETVGEDSGATSAEPVALTPESIYDRAVTDLRAGTIKPTVSSFTSNLGVTKQDARFLMSALEQNEVVTKAEVGKPREVIAPLPPKPEQVKLTEENTPEIYNRAVTELGQTIQPKVSDFKKQLGLTEPDARSLMQALESDGVVSKAEIGKPRRVLMTPKQRAAHVAKRTPPAAPTPPAPTTATTPAAPTAAKRAPLSAVAGTAPVQRQAEDANAQVLAETDVEGMAEVEERVNYAKEAFAKSAAAEEFSERSTLWYRLFKSREWGAAGKSIFNAGKYRGLDVLVKAPPTEFLIDVASQYPELDSLVRAHKLMEAMNGRRARVLEGGDKVLSEMRKLIGDDPARLKLFGETILTSTIAGVDMRTDTKAPADLKALYARLGKDGQKAYGMYFDYYDNMMNYLKQILVSNVESLGGSIEEKNKLLEKVREVLDAKNRIRPYAPLVRNQSGQFWLAVGEGKSREFYTRASVDARDDLAAELAKTRGTTVQALRESGEFEIGNDLNELRKTVLQGDDNLLRSIFELVDKTVTEGPVEEANKAGENLKESIFQMWIHLQPEQSMLKNFAKRKEFPPAGFTTDVLQNLNGSVLKFASQMPRMQYAPQVRQAIRQAHEAVKARPELTPYVQEIEKRTNNALAQDPQGVVQDALNFMTKHTFTYFMSTSTAALQVLGVYQTSVPQLLKNHSFASVSREMGRALAVWNSVGMKDKDGNWKMPTITEAAGIKDEKGDSPEVAARKAEERLAVQAMLDKDVGETTAARDLYGYEAIPTSELNTPYQRINRIPEFLVGGLVHHTERISRELVYLTSFRLWREKSLTAFRNSAEYKAAKDKVAAEHEYIKSRMEELTSHAVTDVNDSLFNYTRYGKPRYMTAPAGRLATQFLTFQINQFMFMARNLVGMIKPMDKETRVGCMKAFTAAMFNTWVLSGALGLFGAPAILGLVTAFYDMWEDDKPADLKRIDAAVWFKTQGIQEVLRDIDIFGEDTVKALSRIIADGPVNYIFGADIGSRTAMANLGTPPDVRQTSDPRATAGEWLLTTLGGAPASMLLQRWNGLTMIADGEVQKGIETLLPAIYRNLAQAYRYYTEGETTKDNEVLAEPDSFDVADLVMKSVGFTPVPLAEVKNLNRSAIKAEKKIETARESVLDEIGKAALDQDADALRDAYRKMNDFNLRYAYYPGYLIEPSSVEARVENVLKRRAQSWRGYEITEKNIGLASQFLRDSRQLMRETLQENRE